MHHSDLSTLSKLVSRLASQKEVEEFFVGILTPKEIAEIALRIQIVKQLKAGISQRDISSNLGVGIATITRGSKEIQAGRFSQSWWATTDKSWREA